MSGVKIPSTNGDNCPIEFEEIGFGKDYACHLEWGHCHRIPEIAKLLVMWLWNTWLKYIKIVVRNCWVLPIKIPGYFIW